jgi:hypothetical protein
MPAAGSGSAKEAVVGGVATGGAVTVVEDVVVTGGMVVVVSTTVTHGKVVAGAVVSAGRVSGSESLQHVTRTAATVATANTRIPP